MVETLRGDSIDIRAFGVRDGQWIVALAIFAVAATGRQFWFGERPAVKLPLRTATLFGSTSLGKANVDAATTILKRIANATDVDLVTFRDVPRDDYLYDAVRNGCWKGPSHISHHRTTRRLIVLPKTIDAYWASLRPTTRKAGQRDLKMFERLAPTYSVFSAPDDIAEFLTRAAAVSGKTYQSRIGVGLADTPLQRQHFTNLATRGQARGYIASVDGEDVAFVWGDISHGVMYFRITGFDPALGRWSPGKAIVLFVLRDLIETGAAHTFDFSGRDMDMKERFSTSSIECADFLITRWSSPRGILAIVLEKVFAAPRRLAPRLLGADRVRRLRKVLRG